MTLARQAGVAKRTVFAQFLVSLVPALFIVAILGVTYRIATAPDVQASTAPPRTLKIPTTANIPALALAAVAGAGLVVPPYSRPSQVVRFFRIIFDCGAARGKG